MAFLDADDLWVPEYLDVMKQLIHDYPKAEMYTCGFSRLYSDGSVIDPPQSSQRDYIDYFRHALWIHTSALIVAKETAIDVGLFKTDYTLGEDIDLMIRLTLRGKVAYEPTALEIHPVGLPSSLCTSGAKNCFLPVPGEPEICSVKRISQITQFYEQQIFGTAMANLIRGYRKEARKQLRGITIRKKKAVLYQSISYFPTPIIVWIHQRYNKYIWRRKL